MIRCIVCLIILARKKSTIDFASNYLIFAMLQSYQLTEKDFVKDSDGVSIKSLLS